MVKNAFGSLDSTLLGRNSSPMLRTWCFRQEGSVLTEGLHTSVISPSLDFFISGEAAKDHLKIKTEANYWLLEATGHHILLEGIEICHEPFLLSPSGHSFHMPPVKVKPESPNWFNYPNYFKLLLQ